MHRPNKNRIHGLVRVFCAAGLSLLCAPAFAAENNEVVTSNGAAIVSQAWQKESFPLRWYLSAGGVVNNDSQGKGTLGVSNAAAIEEVDKGIQAWADVSNAGISIYADETSPNTASGCDFVNLATWADDPGTFTPNIITRGVTTTYIGPNITLSAANRKGISCGALPLSEDAFANDTPLKSGAILDMDMSFNSAAFDFSTDPNQDPKVADISAESTHVFGHMLGLSPSSLTYADSSPATMFPIMNAADKVLQGNIVSLELDDMAAAGRTYPASGYYPGGTTPYTFGAVAGRVSDMNGQGLSGVRLWAFSAEEPALPMYEAISATAFSADPDKGEGDYIMSGMEPGEYFICAVPWKNGLHSSASDDPRRYNKSAKNGRGNVGFPTMCYDGIAFNEALPKLDPENGPAKKIVVAEGKTVDDADFVIAEQPTDLMLVLDKSGSMGLDSALSGKTKMAALQDAAHAFIDTTLLIGGQRLGLAQFGDGVQPLFDLQPLSDTTAKAAHAAVDKMTPEGKANIAAGIESALATLTDLPSPNGRQAMLVFSDGKQNPSAKDRLTELKTVVADNDIKLYSVGFGTDIDDAALSDIAYSTGGTHVTEPDLDASDLAKYFLHAAASATGLAVLTDQKMVLQAGANEKNSIYVGPDERSLVIAVHWTERKTDQATLTLVSPGGCRFKTAEASKGIRTIKGATYLLADVTLPLECNGKPDSVGEWSAMVSGAPDISRRTPESVGLSVFARSVGTLAVRTALIGKKPSLIVKMQSRGRMLSKGVTIAAEVLGPARNTGDSAQEDTNGVKGGASGKAKPAEEGRVFFAKLYDDATHGDEKAGDGIFVGPVRTELSGVYRVRLKGTYATPRMVYKKEAATSFYFSPEAVHVMPEEAPLKIRYVD